MKSNSFDGYSVTNSKRFDFLIVDSNYIPKVAVEYNGGGHYQKNYRDRDLTKKIACEKAGIIFFAIQHTRNLGSEIRKLRELLI